MPRLIDASGMELPNPWQLLPRGGAPATAKGSALQTKSPDEKPAPPPEPVTLATALANPSGHLLVNAALWLTDKAGLLNCGKQIGVWLDSDQGANLIAADLPQLPLVALNFPGFMDGRAYSTAVVLRQHLGYTGELRAIGDVLRDQLFYMKRCGFSTFDLRDSVKLEDARRAFKDYSATYASTVEEPQPLFRRRAGGP